MPRTKETLRAHGKSTKKGTNIIPEIKHLPYPERLRLLKLLTLVYMQMREDRISSVRPADFPAKVIRCSEWQHRQNLSPHNCAVNLDESLAKGHTSPWAAWRCLNRLRTGVACSKEQRKRWKYFNGDTTCECGQAPETTKHMLQCPLLAHPCTLDDLQKFNENARKCVDKWKNAV